MCGGTKRINETTHDMKHFNETFFNDLIQRAKNSPRLRANNNVHTSLDEPVQRLFIAIEPGSYVQPHRHPEPEKWEFFMVLRGKLAMLIFDDQGAVIKRYEMSANGTQQGIEVPPNTWHTVTALESGSLFFETKQGPYTPLSDKDFASWAPKEGDSKCADYCEWFSIANVGERFYLGKI